MKKELYSEKYEELEEFWDFVSDLLIVRIGDRVLGGARLIHHYAKPSNIEIPIEQDGAIIDKMAPELELSGHNYCEFSRITLAPELRNSIHLLEILRHMTSRALEYNCKYIFAETSLTKGRIFRNLSKKLGLKGTLRKDLPMPKRNIYNHYEVPLELYLFVTDLSHLIIPNYRKLV